MNTTKKLFLTAFLALLFTHQQHALADDINASTTLTKDQNDATKPVDILLSNKQDVINLVKGQHFSLSIKDKGDAPGWKFNMLFSNKALKTLSTSDNTSFVPDSYGSEVEYNEKNFSFIADTPGQTLLVFLKLDPTNPSGIGCTASVLVQVSDPEANNSNTPSDTASE